MMKAFSAGSVMIYDNDSFVAFVKLVEPKVSAKASLKRKKT